MFGDDYFLKKLPEQHCHMIQLYREVSYFQFHFASSQSQLHDGAVSRGWRQLSLSIAWRFSRIAFVRNSGSWDIFSGGNLETSWED